MSNPNNNKTDVQYCHDCGTLYGGGGDCPVCYDDDWNRLQDDEIVDEDGNISDGYSAVFGT